MRDVTPVPDVGPLDVGAIYRKKDLHGRFGGNLMQGIAPSPTERVVLLFHTKEPAHQFYSDGWDDNAQVYWYSGMGNKGDMKWNAANIAVRDHVANGRDLLFFERYQRKDGLWEFLGSRYCVDHKIETRPDRNSVPRKAILFALATCSDSPPSASSPRASGATLADLRQRAVGFDATPGRTQARVRALYERSEALASYARLRSNGTCEACRQPAPFFNQDGEPFLEVHHITRLADGGPDLPENVAAVCANCHRRCHYSRDFKEYNAQLALRIAEIEAALDSNGQ